MSPAERQFHLAMQAFNRRDLAQAERLFQEFLQAQPRHFGALNLIAVALIGMGRQREAEPYLARAVAADATSDASFYNYAIVLKTLGRPTEALAQFDRALRLNPRHAKALNNRGVTLSELGEHEQALAEFDKAIALDASYAEPLYNKGNTLSELGRHRAALDAYDQSLAIEPSLAAGHNNRGRTLQQLGRPGDALVAYDRAVALQPLDSEAQFNRGVALASLGRLEEALAAYDRAIAVRADHAPAHHNRGVALMALKRPLEALASYDRALAAAPNDAETFSNRANALVELRRLAEAVASYDRAIALRPEYAEACNNRGVALKELKRLEEAIASYDAAIAINPDYAEALTNRANALRDLKRLEEASASYDAAAAIDPGLDFLMGEALHARMLACDWRRHDEDLAAIGAGIAANARVVAPFIALSAFDSCALHLAAARIWVEAKYRRSEAAPFAAAHEAARRIRVGYFSSDFRLHPMSLLMQGVFRSHDRARFETTAFSFDNRPGDALNLRLRDAFDHFLDVSALSEQQVALLSRRRSIDIAVDLAGFTGGRRTGVFAQRAAPLQVNFLGFPGTMAAPFMDYVIADSTVVDASTLSRYSEKIVALPDTYYPTSYGDEIFRTDRTFGRAELGLPERGVVYCCFNNNYKITPDVFALWMRILRRVEGAVLWLFEDNATAAANLRREAASRGVAADRLIFARRMPVAEHLARLQAADLFLDTFPYNAHTTATDALWAGVPIITKPGESFAARVAASVLKAGNAPELIVATWERYEALAIDLATNPDRLAAIKRQLAGNRSTAPLFDTARYTRNLETALAAMQARRRAGLAPDHIVLSP